VIFGRWDEIRRRGIGERTNMVPGHFLTRDRVKGRLLGSEITGNCYVRAAHAGEISTANARRAEGISSHRRRDNIRAGWDAHQIVSATVRCCRRWGGRWIVGAVYA